MIDDKRSDGSTPTDMQILAGKGAFIISVVLLAVLFISAVIFDGNVTLNHDIPFNDQVKDHMQAIMGLQIAGAVAFALVVFLRQTDGPITIEVAQLKFSGAASQIVMWIFCFLAIAAAIKMCWSA